MKEYTLENWGVTFDPNASLYTAPELLTQHLCGDRSDGRKDIITSAIQYVDDDGKVYTKSGSIYNLGAPHPEYEVIYPNAKQRFLDSIKK